MTGPRAVPSQVMGILLAGSHPWTKSAFDLLAPRTLLPVGHRPLIWYGLAWMHRQGLGEVAVCVNRETRMLKTRLGRHVPPGLAISYHEDSMPRGAAGCARDAALTSHADTFVVADGTLIPEVDLHLLLARHHGSGACVTVVVHSESEPNGHSSPHAPSGIYIFSRRALDTVPARGFCDIKEELIPRLYAAGERIITYEVSEEPPRVLDSATYLAANEWMVERLVKNGGAQDAYVKVADALVHRGASVAEDATLIGPVVVESGARILSKVVVIGPTSIGREATIERGGVVSRSAVWRRSTIGEGVAADRCIVADDARLEAGVQFFQKVVTSTRESELEADWITAKAVGMKRPDVRVSARLKRLILASWPSSAAAQ